MGNLERQSAAAYFAAAIWFAERELVGFAEHLRDEAKQEEQHAAKFADYLISRGQRPVLDAVEPPRQQWPDVEQVIANVFRMEADVTASVLPLKPPSPFPSVLQAGPWPSPCLAKCLISCRLTSTLSVSPLLPISLLPSGLLNASWSALPSISV